MGDRESPSTVAQPGCGLRGYVPGLPDRRPREPQTPPSPKTR